MGHSTKEWTWRMDYCRQKALPPAQSWAWEESEEAYKKFIVDSIEFKKK